ncbi:hypothetical protein BDV25DRAFT_155168 [Aspergillus avenaceus]|uniref:Uncharacterized protein n=1 Tax=Aspergillus avenaceus TaxID=36643 RepID=A0A5N6TVB7_ASPAV|nr:hypothetical protein BDV25DRAFT_155168 [Aspergillus avenaceus]
MSLKSTMKTRWKPPMETASTAIQNHSRKSPSETSSMLSLVTLIHCQLTMIGLAGVLVP